MKVVVLGATGGTGRELVKQALDVGHEVTAFVRDPAKLQIQNEHLRIAKGDMLDRPSLEAAISGQDAVMSALGAYAFFSQTTALSEGTRNIIAAMQATGVKRLIFETSVGIGDSKNHATWLERKFFFPVVLKHIFADKEIQEKLIMGSDLDWTIVRPARLTHGGRRGKYRIGDEVNEKDVSSTISRADTAEFMLRVLTDDSYIQKAPVISY